MTTKSEYLGAPSADQPSEVAYWSHLAKKRLRLLGARERRIVHLLKEKRAWVTRTSRRLSGASTSLTSGGGSGSVRGAICTTFRSHCSEALRVAECESHFDVYARGGTGGDYWGLFQFGSFARAHYGFAWNAWAQARSAYRYFLDAGWSPWQCRP